MNKAIVKLQKHKRPVVTIYLATTRQKHYHTLYLKSKDFIMAIILAKDAKSFINPAMPINKMYIDSSELHGVYLTEDFAKYLPSDIVAINVIGRHWHDKTYGNTYFDFCIELALINGCKTVCVYKAFEYGYGNYYMQCANTVLKLLGLSDKPTFNSCKTGCLKRELMTDKDFVKKDYYQSLNVALKLAGVK